MEENCVSYNTKVIKEIVILISSRVPNLFQKSDNFWYAIYLVYGYGGPFIFLMSSIITHNVEGDHIKPGFGDGVCFLNCKLYYYTSDYDEISILPNNKYFLVTLFDTT